MLEDGKIPGKNGQETWTMGKIRHILDDEKYTGDALLQKTYTVDPISKKKRKNDGQLPMYVVKDCHEPIISHEMFDLVQAEKKRRLLWSAKRTRRPLRYQLLSIPANMLCHPYWYVGSAIRFTNGV